ncbi:hypothetical protein CASFOL_038006 [Castilleja foliolosa]|uniref:Pectinesterase inhibitor domain-containing protein n=1 Tax=Castilleja foliolosa TaxID=1961234 RepID=A0ABD3BJR9_9LAMI
MTTMKHFAPHYLLPITILFLLTPRSYAQTLINRICLQTSDYWFCQETFNKHIYTPGMGIKGLTQIAITQTLIEATDTKIFISRAMQSEKNVELQNLYKQCETGYGDLVDLFTDAKFDFAREDYRNMLNDVGICERFVTDCQNVMNNKVPQLSVRNAHNRVLVQMSIISGQILTTERMK